MNILKEVVTQLRAAGLPMASYEYPGYISIGDRSYGTANGNWGWNDVDGNGGETIIPHTCIRPELIVAEIINIERREMAAKNKSEGEEQFLDTVGAALRGISELEPYVIHTGGGIFCMVVEAHSRVELHFGTCDVNWGADVYVDGEFIDGESLRSEDVILMEVSPKNSAVAILRLVDVFKANHLQRILGKVDDAKKCEEKEREFKQAMENFSDAARTLTVAWEQLPGDSKFHDVATKKYPFNKSFDELYLEILDWSFQTVSEKV